MALADSPAAGRLVRRKREDVLHSEDGSMLSRSIKNILIKVKIKYDQCRYEDRLVQRRLVRLMLRSRDCGVFMLM